MASLEKRIRAMEVTGVLVVAPRILVTFVCPTRGLVGVRLWSGGMVDRLDDETEAQFLARVKGLEVTHDQA